MTRRPWVLALVFSMMLLAFATNEARAQLSSQQKQEIHVHYQQATRAYDLGKYQEAVDEYQKVYEIDGDPVMLYNIAQAYRLNDQPQESIHFYRRYLQRSPEARNKEDVERKITAMEKLIEERRKAAALVAPPPPKTEVKPVAVPEPATPTPVVPAVVAAPPPPPPPPPPSTTRRVVGWLDGRSAEPPSIAVAIVEGIVAKNRGDTLTQMQGQPNTPIADPARVDLRCGSLFSHKARPPTSSPSSAASQGRSRRRRRRDRAHHQRKVHRRRPTTTAYAPADRQHRQLRPLGRSWVGGWRHGAEVLSRAVGAGSGRPRSLAGLAPGERRLLSAEDRSLYLYLLRCRSPTPVLDGLVCNHSTNVCAPARDADGVRNWNGRQGRNRWSRRQGRNRRHHHRRRR